MAFHSGMMATVLVAGEESEPFAVEVGVKQGCAMAPVLFNIYLAASNFLFARRNAGNGSVHLVNRLDGSLFNLQRLKARTKVSMNTSQRFSMLKTAPSEHTPRKTYSAL